jgi:hypothetical protein
LLSFVNFLHTQGRIGPRCRKGAACSGLPTESVLEDCMEIHPELHSDETSSIERSLESSAVDEDVDMVLIRHSENPPRTPDLLRRSREVRLVSCPVLYVSRTVR